MTVSRKTIMRAVCFTIAAVLAMAGGIVWNGMRAGMYRRRLENAAACSVREAAGGMNALSVELKKSSYAGTSAQMAELSAKILKESSAVKAALESLPTDGVGLDEAYRFLSQVGDYSVYLSRQAANGLPPSDTDRRNIEKLMEYSTALTRSLQELEGMISSGELKAESLLGLKGQALFNEANNGAISLENVEKGFEGYPVLIYDGSFSDGLKGRSPEGTKGLPRISRDEARTVAAKFAGTDESTLKSGGDEVSEMPSYTFYNEHVTIGVTMDGGMVTYLSSSREPGEKSLSIARGRKLAHEFLRERGMDSMTETYYQLDMGVLTVNFVWYQDDVTCYTDLVKVGVAMDNGEVAFYDARGFIGSHHERDLRQVSLPPEVAVEALSPNLRPESYKLALIPTPGGNEVLTWEFLCAGRDEEKLLVYVNATTGAEEQILFLIDQIEAGRTTIPALCSLTLHT